MTSSTFLLPIENRLAGWHSNLCKAIFLLTTICLGSSAKTSAQQYATTQISPIITGACVLCSVTDPGKAVDQSSLTDHSTLSIPVGTYNASIGQMLIWSSVNADDGSDSLIIGLGSNHSSVIAGLYAPVSAETFNGTTSNMDAVTATGSNIRIVDGNTVEIAMKPAKTFDRVYIKLSPVDGSTALWSVRIFYAYRKKAQGPDANGILYVKKGSTGGGTSWSNAMGELGDALKLVAEDPSIKQVWVAGGTYHPTDIAADAGTSSDLRNRSFLLKNNVKLYGGFAGTETSLAQRDLSIEAYQSILSGDMEDDDPPFGLNIGDWVLHAVIASKGNYTLDGFTVMRTNAEFPGIPVTIDGTVVSGSQGGGIVALDANLEVSNCIFKAISASYGGAIYGKRSGIIVSNTSITGIQGASGTAVFGEACTINVINTTISGNKGVNGMIVNSGTVTNISNSIIYGNHSGITDGNAIVSNSIVQGGYPGTNVMAADPMFVEPYSPNSAPDSRGNYFLQPASPAINAGDNSKIVGVDRSSIDPALMADELKGSGCSGVDCSVENPEFAIGGNSYADYAVLNIPLVTMQTGSAELDLSWSGKTINSGDFVGFVIDQHVLDLEVLLADCKIMLYDASGNELQSQHRFTSYQTTTLNGASVKYIGITATQNAAYARIHLTQMTGFSFSLRVYGAFIWPAGPGATLTKDLIGQPRVTGSAVDMGAYEIQVSNQTIRVNDISKTYGDEAFEPGFSASSGLPVSYASADNSIAEAFQDAADNNKWKIRMLKAGTVRITASQAGNDAYFAAPDETFDLNISRKRVTLGVKPSTTITKVYDGNTSGSITVADLEFAVGDIINNDDVQPVLSSTAVSYDNKNAGSGKTITLPVSGIGLTGDDANNYEIGNSAALSFSNAGITPASLTITANAQTKVYGAPDPAFTYVANGLIGSDPISGALSRVPGENAGGYDIELGTLDAGSNYNLSFTSAKLSITKASQTISWIQNNLEAGCNGATNLQLLASSNSGLPITYTVANTGIATVNGDILTPVSGGVTTITANQPGDQNHEAATAVVKDFKVSLAGVIRQHFSDVLIFDNSGNEYVQWQWYKNGSEIPGATQAYYSEPQALNGAYHAVATDRNGNSVEACPLIASGTTMSRGIRVNPNPAKPGSTIAVTCNYNISALAGARLLLSTATGSQVQQITNVQPVTQLTLPAAAGLYVITLILPTGEKASVNILSK